jgi:hypothetical protein
MNKELFNYLKLQQPLEILNLLESSSIDSPAVDEFEKFLKDKIVKHISDHLGLDKDEKAYLAGKFFELGL